MSCSPTTRDSTTETSDTKAGNYPAFLGQAAALRCYKRFRSEGRTLTRPSRPSLNCSRPVGFSRLRTRARLFELVGYDVLRDRAVPLRPRIPEQAPDRIDARGNGYLPDDSSGCYPIADQSPHTQYCAPLPRGIGG